MISFIRNIYSLIKPFLDKVKDDNLFAIAGQSAFFLVLSLFPLAVFAGSVLQNLNIPIDVLEEVLGSIFNKDVSEYLSGYLNNAYTNSSSISAVSLIATLWSASQGAHALTNGLNRIHKTYENRNWFLLRVRAMVFTLAMVLLLVVSLAVIVLGSLLNESLSPYLVFWPWFVTMLYHLRYVILFLYLVLLFALIYRNTPNLSRQTRRRAGFCGQLPGALLCAVAWFALSLGISIYVGDFHGFSVYGSIIKLAVLMIWLYFCMVCLMLGAELNYVYQYRIESFIEKRRLSKKERRARRKANKKK